MGKLLLTLAAFVALASPGVAAATVTSSVVNGELTASSDGSDTIAVTCDAPNVKVNGNDPGSGPALCSTISKVALAGGPGANVLDLSGVTATAFALFVSGSAVDQFDGADRLIGSGNVDYLDGGAGDDLIQGGFGNDVLVGGPGARNELYGGTGDDSLTGGDGHDWLVGDPGNDTITGGDGNDGVDGGEGDDVIEGGSFGDFYLSGGPGNDTIRGGAGDDGLKGEDGDDLLDGQAGSDLLLGGDGNDTLEARDGAGDNIECGAGLVDLARPDGFDRPNPDCERVAVANISPPSVSGVARAGETLTAGPGAWLGLPVPAFSYGWLRCNALGESCAGIGEAGPTYAVRTSDVGATLRVNTSATNAEGTASANSPATAIVLAAPQVPQRPPVVRCVVPNVKGKTIARARRLLVAKRCRLGTVRRAYSANVRRGRIIRQTRRPGARLPRAAKVGVLVSRGRRR